MRWILPKSQMSHCLSPTGFHLILVTLQCDPIELLEHHIQLLPAFFRGWHTSVVFDSSSLRTSIGQTGSSYHTFQLLLTTNIEHWTLITRNLLWASYVRSTRVTVSQEHVFQLIQSQNFLSRSEISSALQFFLPVSWNNNYSTFILHLDCTTYLIGPIHNDRLYVAWCSLVGLVEYRS